MLCLLAACAAWSLHAPPACEAPALPRTRARDAWMRLYDRHGQPINLTDESNELQDLFRVQGAPTAAVAEPDAPSDLPSDRDRLAELLDGGNVSVTDAGKERMIGRLKRRLRRRRDAAALLELEDVLDEREALMLKREVSIASTADLFWNSLSASLQGKNPRKDAAASMDRAAEQIDEAWRRDALRALLAVQRAPEALRSEVVRQRLAKLQPELRMLGLHRMRPGSITEENVRAARTARARDLHPDMRLSRTEQSYTGLLRFASRPEDDEDAMVQLNAAYTKVRRAVTSPMLSLDA